jgi:hypothetical protein
MPIWIGSGRAYANVHGDDWVQAVRGLVHDWNATEDDASRMVTACGLMAGWRSAVGSGESESGDESGDFGVCLLRTLSGAGGSRDEGEGEGREVGGSLGGMDTDGESRRGVGQPRRRRRGRERRRRRRRPPTTTTPEHWTRPMRSATCSKTLPGRRAGCRRSCGGNAGAGEAEEDRKMTDAADAWLLAGESRHHHVEVVPVTAEDRRFAVELARRMRSLALPEVARAHRPSVLPPGRLRGRGLVAREAQAKLGMVPTAEPWRTTRKTITRTPPPVIGIMLDVSGSMRVAQRPAAVAAWALAEAGRSVQARTALTTFGDRGRLVEHKPTQLTVTDCGGSWENFREAFALLDQRLRLTTPAQGARLLCVVSDGALVGPDEGQAAARIMRRLESQGVVCVWLPIGTAWAGHWGEGWTNRGGHVIECGADASAITEGVAAAMRRVRVSL